MISISHTNSVVGEQVELDLGRPNLPEFFPDETLYSWMARVHQMCGNASACDTSRGLFKHRYAGLLHDLPFSLEVLSKLLCNGLENPIDIAWQKTIVPFYLILKSPICRLKVLDSMQRCNANTTRLELSLRRTRFLTTHPLKRCQKCMSSDLSKRGCTYWHREHQWPGVVLCPIHELLLEHYEVEKTTPWLLRLLLPQDVGSRNNHIFTTPSPSQMAKLTKLSEFIRRWSNEPITTSLGLPELRQLIRRQICLPATSSPMKKAHLEEAAKSFFSHVSGLTRYPELAGLPSSKESSLQLLMRVLDDRRHPGHPLGMVGLMAWAFPSWEAVTEGLSRNFFSDT